MFREFIDWWIQHLTELLPRGLRDREITASDAVLLEPIADSSGRVGQMRVTIRRNHVMQGLGTFDFGSDGLIRLRRTLASARRPDIVRLRLPAAVLLEKRVSFPIEAERELMHVIANEMDHETPFAEPEVFWGYDIEERDREAGRVRVRLSLVPRAAYADMVQRLEEIDVGPDEIEAESSAGAARLLHLDVASARKHNRRHWEIRLLAASCGVLALALIGVPFIEQSVALDRAETEIAELRPSVADADVLRARINSSRAGAEVITSERKRAGDALRVLAEATDVLPADTTHLTNFSLSQRRLSLDGRSTSAASLITAMLADRLFVNPAFAAPVTRLEGSPYDLFTITAQVAP